MFHIPQDRLFDPKAYSEAAAQVLNAVGKGERKSTDAKRDVELIKDLCLTFTGVSLEDMARQQKDPIERFIGLMEASEAELVQVEKAIKDIDDKRVTPTVKKKWRKLIHRALALQQQARSDPAKFMVYIMRNDDPGHVGEVLFLQPFHLDFFDIWRDPGFANSLIEAPVGHSKSTCLRALRCFEVGENPSLRCLYITDETSKARKTIQVMKRTMKSPRFRAIYPDVRVLGKTEDTEDSGLRFTVTRANWQSREPTFEGASILSKIQGNRYDRIDGDDFCPPSVANHDAERRDINKRWVEVVESRCGDPKSLRIRIICTPWHPEDVAGLIAKDVRDGRLTDWRVGIEEFRINDDEQGLAVPLWPSRFDTKFLENRKVRDGHSYDFKYRLISASKGQKAIGRVHFYDADPKGAFQTPHNLALLDAIAQGERWMSIDPAGTANATSSDTGIVDFVITPRGYVFVPSCLSLHGTTVEVVEAIVERIASAPPPGYHGMHFEAAGGVKVGLSMTVEGILRRLTDRGYPADRLKIVSTGANPMGGRNVGKLTRVKQASGFLEHGLVRFAGIRRFHRDIGGKMTAILCAEPNSPIAKLTDNLKDFDGVHNSDAIDALTQWIIVNRFRIHDPGQDRGDPVVIKPTPIQDAAGRAFAAGVDQLIKEMTEGQNPNEEEAAFMGGMTRRLVA